MTPSPNNIPLPSERNLRIFQQVVVDGQSREQVAGEFGLSRGHVGHIVREVRRQLEQQRAKADPKWVVELHVVRLERINDEYLRAWQRSLEDQQTDEVSTEKDGKQRAKHQRRSSTGDPRYLYHSQRVLAEIRRLRGVERYLKQLEERDAEQAPLETRAAELDQLLAEVLHERAEAADDRIDHGEIDWLFDRGTTDGEGAMGGGAA